MYCIHTLKKKRETPRAISAEPSDTSARESTVNLLLVSAYYRAYLLKQGHPKQVLSQGWLPFVRRWKLAIGDRVLLHKIQDKAGKGLYRIEVIERAKQSPGVLSPSILNHDGDSTMRNFGKEPAGSTVTSHSNDQAMTYNLTERLNDLPITDGVGSKMVEFICLKPRAS
ncbi:Uncharacterized protein TCM_006243 [Theobroma cacao]|uniref:TF-B3 domain-containing protein n=1 Tax=Theobroma cacao TaxID=3641 RepID=A0A061DWG4_THECC|nr:Uncharacterized protein TCM_006243 [Theobroma cacao]